MIQINPLKSYIDGGVRAALTTPPSASLVFDLPGKAIWVKGVKLKGTDHTYTFSHDNYITLTNTPDSNESEDIKIGVNTSALKSAIDTTYGVVSTTTNGLAPKFSNENKSAASAATTYYFLGWAGSTLKWYQAPFRNIRINSETTDCLGVNNTNPLIISSGNGISVTWDSTNKKIVITNTKPDVNHNTHYTTMLYIGENNDTKANKNIANPYLKLFDDNVRRATFQIKAGSGIAVASDTNGNITITNSSPDVNHNTDYRVTQSETTTANYRPLVVGYTNVSTAGSGMTGSVTNQVYVSNKFYVQPSTGNLYATTFVGPLAGNASTATALTTNAGNSINPVYFSGGKPVACTMSTGRGDGIVRSFGRGAYTSANLYFGNGTIVTIDPKGTGCISANDTILSLGDSSIRNTQLLVAYNRDGVYYRRITDGLSYGDWKRLAFTTDNVASATKLTSSAGNATLPIYFSDGKPVACTASSVFSNLSNSGNNISVTVAGQNRTLTVGYADTVDGWHLSEFHKSAYVTFSTSGLSSYWGKLWDITITTWQYNDMDMTLLLHSSYNTRYSIVNVRLRQNGSSGAYNFSASLHILTGNISTSDMRLYYDNSTGACSLWVNCWGQWGVVNCKVLSYTMRIGSEDKPQGTFYTTDFSSTQTLPSSSYVNGTNVGYVANSDTCDGLHVHGGRNNEANKIVRTDGSGYLQVGYINSSSGNEGNNSSPARVWGTNGSDNYMRTYLTSALSVKYAASAGNSDTVDGYHATSLWRSDGATWNPGANVSLNASGNNQEWSFDIRRNGYTGCYWHVWDSSLNTMLKVNADNGKVYAPYNFVGNLEGNASSATTATKLASSGYANNALSYYQTDQAFDGSDTGWAHYIIANHNDGASYYHYTIRLPFWGVPQYRRLTGSTSNVTSWYNFITAENIGSQSVNYANSAGNADTTDGLHLYTRSLGVNGTSWIFASTANANSTTNIYAATSAGTSDQILKSTGGTPTWINQSDISAGYATYLNVQYCRDDDSPSNKGLWNTIKNGTTNAITNRVRFYTIYGTTTALGAPTDGFGELLEICSYNTNHWQPLLWFGSGKNGRLYYRNKEYNNNTWGSWRTVAWTSEIPTVTNYYWANVKISASSSTSTSPTFSTCYTSNWFRSTGSTGWYNETYSGGWYMNDTTWIRTWNSKGIYTNTGAIYNLGHAYFACNSGYNVGIGTSAPSYKLHVTGDIYTTTGFKKNGSSNSYVLLGGGGHKAISDFSMSHSHPYLPLAGGTMTGQIQRAGQGSSWIKGRDNAMIRVNSRNGYSVLSSIKTTNGSWEIGHYDASGYNNNLLFGYYTDSDYSANNNNGRTKVTFTSNGQVTAAQFNGALNGNAATASYTPSAGNADTLDGNHASAFATAGHNHFTRLSGTNIDTELGNMMNWHYEISNATGTLPFTETWRLVYVMGGGDANYTTQISTGLTTNTALYFRHRRSGSWDAWRTVLDSVNYASYALPLAGGTMTAGARISHENGNLYIGRADNNGWVMCQDMCSQTASGDTYWSLRTNGTFHALTTCIGGHLWLNKQNASSSTGGASQLVFGLNGNQHVVISSNTGAVIINPSTSSSTGQLILRTGTSSTSEFAGNIKATHFYENSDIRYKRVLRNLSINFNTIANLPLFDFEWIENNTIGTGTSAQAVQQILPNIVSGTDKLTLDYGVLGTIAGITACKELVTLKSELLQLKEKVKLLEDRLRKYENI